MKRLFTKRRGLIIAGILVLFLAAGLLIKDRLALWVLTRYLSRAYPEWEVRVKGLDLGHRGARADAVAFKIPVGEPRQVWSGRVLDVRLTYGPGLPWASPGPILKEARCVLEFLSGPGLRLEGAKVSLRPKADGKGVFLDVTCERVSYMEKEVSDVAGQAFFSKDRLSVADLEGKFLGGVVSVSGQATFGASSFDGAGEVSVAGLDVAQLIRVFKLRERVDATGFYAGQFVFVVRDGRFQVLSGTIRNETGGRLHVADASLLKGAGVGQQAGNIVVENLKNYHYDKGEIVFSLEGRNVKLDFMLEGLAGTRRLEVVWHGPEEDGCYEKRD